MVSLSEYVYVEARGQHQVFFLFPALPHLLLKFADWHAWITDTLLPPI